MVGGRLSLMRNDVSFAAIFTVWSDEGGGVMRVGE